MSIMALLASGAERTHSASPSRRRERRHRKQEFRPDLLEQFEDRIVMSVGLLPYSYSGGISIQSNSQPNIGPGTFNDTSTQGGTEHDPNNLATQIGLTASQPVIDPNNSNEILLTYHNAGSKAASIGVAVYQCQSGAVAGAPLNTEVLIGFQYYNIAAGATLNVDVGVMMCIEIDTFIHTAYVTPTATSPTTVSNVVTQYTLGDGQPYGAGPEVDAGYNWTPSTLGATGGPTINSHASGAGTTGSPFVFPPSYPSAGGVQGTLLSYAVTTSGNYVNGVLQPNCAPGPCESECYWVNNPCNWSLPTFTTTTTTTTWCGKTTTETVTVTGLSIGDTFYTVDQLENILQTNCSYNNAAVTRAQEEIFAKLNLINNFTVGSCMWSNVGYTSLTPVINALTTGDTLLALYTTGTLGSCGSYVWSCSTNGQNLLTQAGILDNYNTACSCSCSNWWCGGGCNSGCNYVNSCDTSCHSINYGNSWGSNSWGNNCGISNWSSDSCDNSCFSNSCNTASCYSSLCNSICANDCFDACGNYSSWFNISFGCWI